MLHRLNPMHSGDKACTWCAEPFTAITDVNNTDVCLWESERERETSPFEMTRYSIIPYKPSHWTLSYSTAGWHRFLTLVLHGELPLLHMFCFPCSNIHISALLISWWVESGVLRAGKDTKMFRDGKLCCALWDLLHTILHWTVIWGENLHQSVFSTCFSL